MIKVQDRAMCCGCGACAERCPKNCIVMQADNEGFLYPVINKELCIGCGLCERTCPVLNNERESEFKQNAYLVQHKDLQVRKESTSGGAFSAIAQTVLDHGGVVYGAAFDGELVVSHIAVKSKEELYKFRNSKYVQSDTKHTFSEVEKHLNQGKMVLYSGTPCQIEGINRFLNRKYDNLILVDVVCHAVPSPMVWEKYKEFNKGNSGTLVEAVFRDKTRYGYQYSQMKVCAQNKKASYSGVESDPFLRLFFSGLSIRPSCLDCKFKKRYHVSDITIWDSFETKKFNPQMEDNTGVTRVLVHSQKGNKIVSQMSKYAVIYEIDASKAIEDAYELTHSTFSNPNREHFFADMNSLTTDELFQKYCPQTMPVRLEAFFRKLCCRLGIYRLVKKVGKKTLRILKR